MAKRDNRLRVALDWMLDRVIRAVLGLLMLMPYARRVPVCGWLMAHVAAPMMGYRGRVRDNLALVMPDLSAAEVRRMTRAVPDNLGRTFIELYSGQEFARRVAGTALLGPGVALIDAAHQSGQPVLLVTGHIGNYDAARAALLAKGYKVGGLYRPMNNAFFNDHYVKAISKIGEPLFPRGRLGLSNMVRFLRSGGMLGVVLDQFMVTGAKLRFMGRPAMTALSTAELALRYNALVIPTYGIRRADGLSFDLIFEDAVPHSTPEIMTQALNDSLEGQVRRNMDQWLWTHRRWKMRRGKKIIELTEDD